MNCICNFIDNIIKPRLCNFKSRINYLCSHVFNTKMGNLTDLSLQLLAFIYYLSSRLRPKGLGSNIYIEAHNPFLLLAY